jgi:hypothetical protein
MPLIAGRGGVVEEVGGDAKGGVPVTDGGGRGMPVALGGGEAVGEAPYAGGTPSGGRPYGDGGGEALTAAFDTSTDHYALGAQHVQVIPVSQE